MSLLMQALKKAERNKLDALSDDDDQVLPSESMDVVALTPDDVLSGRVPPAPDGSSFSLEPMEPLAYEASEPAGGVSEQVPALEPAVPAPHDPTPPQSRRQAVPATQHSVSYEPPLQTLPPLPAIPGGPDLPAMPDMALALAPHEPDTSFLSATPAAPVRDFEETAMLAAQHDAVPDPYREAHDAYGSTGADSGAVHPDAAPTGTQAGIGQAAPAAAKAATPPGHDDALLAAQSPRPVRPGESAQPVASAPAASPAAARTDAPPRPHVESSPPPRASGTARGTAARARAAAQAAAEQDQPRRDPARVRLAVLGGALALVAGTLAGVYWYALTSPGPGAHLPPVPMPPPGATTGPTPVAVVPPPSSLPAGDGETALPTPAAPDATAPGAPYTTQDRLQPAPGQTGLPQARTALPGQPHSASRMPSDDDLQRALQQQAPAVATPPPGPATPPQAAVPAANTGNAANPGNADGAATALNTGVTDIHVLRSVTPQRVNANLQDGYQSFMAGDYATAAQHYAAVLRQDSNNRDALLGIAAIAARRNDTAAATSGYQRLLELNPADPDAQAGLLALRPGDLGHSEMRLKEMLRRDPGAGPLEFALGNLYSQQGRWPDAQQAYFRAYSAAPDNADYAFNLAVGLDRLSQRKLALSYYQRALDLSRTSPAAFDRNAAKRRAEQLAAEKP